MSWTSIGHEVVWVFFPSNPLSSLAHDMKKDPGSQLGRPGGILRQPETAYSGQTSVCRQNTSAQCSTVGEETKPWATLTDCFALATQEVATILARQSLCRFRSSVAPVAAASSVAARLEQNCRGGPTGGHAWARAEFRVASWNHQQ